MRKTFLINYEGYGDEWKEFEGSDHENAAREFAEDYNDEGQLVNHSMYVRVKEGEQGEVKLVAVGAEPDIFYYANEVEDPIRCQQCKKDCRPEILSGEMEDLYDDRFCGNECYEEWCQEYYRTWK